MVSEAGKPTAKKGAGTEWYYPAVTTRHGPRILPDGERKETRSKAEAEARRILSALTTEGSR